MRFKILQYFLILSLIAVFGLRLVLVYFTPLDSDEVMWSVMVERILSSGEHFVFFTDQNFRGSLEAYIILPFLYFFGLNEFTLRINSILFLGLTGFMIFKIIYYLTKKLELIQHHSYVGLLYNMMKIHLITTLCNILIN